MTAFACGTEEKEKPYDYLVTFNYNVGKLTADCPDQFLGVKAGGKVAIQPGYDQGSFADQEIIGYYNEGWYLPEVDEDGNPVIGEDERVNLDRKWDFANDTVTADVTLYANFIVQPKLTIKVDGGEDIVFSRKPGVSLSEPSAAYRPKKDGWTFYDYFEDESFETPFEFPYKFTAEDKTVYAKFIEGNWSIVKTVDEFLNAVGVAGARVYLDSDLDFTGASWRTVNNFTGEIKGNGHRLTGINVQFTVDRTKQKFGLFVNIASGAKIDGLVFDDVSATFNSSFTSPCGAALFAYTIEDGASVTNVIVSGTLYKGKVVDGAAYTLYGFAADYNPDNIDLTGSDFSDISVVDED